MWVFSLSGITANTAFVAVTVRGSPWSEFPASGHIRRYDVGRRARDVTVRVCQSTPETIIYLGEKRLIPHEKIKPLSAANCSARPGRSRGGSRQATAS